MLHYLGVTLRVFEEYRDTQLVSNAIQPRKYCKRRHNHRGEASDHYPLCTSHRSSFPSAARRRACVWQSLRSILAGIIFRKTADKGLRSLIQTAVILPSLQGQHARSAYVWICDGKHGPVSNTHGCDVTRIHELKKPIRYYSSNSQKYLMLIPAGNDTGLGFRILLRCGPGRRPSRRAFGRPNSWCLRGNAPYMYVNRFRGDVRSCRCESRFQRNDGPCLSDCGACACHSRSSWFPQSLREYPRMPS